MPLTENPADQPLVIQSYQEGQLKINGQLYTENLVLTPDYQILPWDGQDPNLLIQGNPELVLIGTGKDHVFLPAQQLIYFYSKGIGVEVMSTAAAVRTYTILSSEGRKIAAGLNL